MKLVSVSFGSRPSRTISTLSLLLVMFTAFSTAPALGQPAAPAWRDTGLELGSMNIACFDLTHRNSLLLNGEDRKISALNLENNQITPVSSNNLAGCSINGYTYSTDPNTGKATRFSDREPQGKALPYGLLSFTLDGSLQLYARSGDYVMYSPDAGDTWQQRPQALRGLTALAVSPADPHGLFAATVEPGNTSDYTVYYSADAGVTWERRSTGKLQFRGVLTGSLVALNSIPGSNSAPGLVEMVLDEGIMGSSNKWHVYVSGDGARTFNEVGVRSLGGDVRMAHTSRGILRLATTSNNANATYKLTLSTDGGATWRELPSLWPADYPYISPRSVSIAVLDTAPANVFIKDQYSLWYSPDGGATWQRYKAEGYYTYISSFLPITVVAVEYNKKNHLYVLNLSTGGKDLTAAATATGAEGSAFFPATGHNLSGAFKRFWENNGGLPQFGYPRTEAFLEQSEQNGQVYIVQYFERNRFEWHPENRGTSNEVLLGLLGQDLTSERRARGEGAFNRFDDPHIAGQLYFPQTGHTLRNAFMRYWQTNGGLAIYGYPISEEFYEVNEDDHKEYVVQYFERNRFEWHPENVDTPYEVLLGALGNALLKLKGYE